MLDSHILIKLSGLKFSDFTTGYSSLNGLSDIQISLASLIFTKSLIFSFANKSEKSKSHILEFAKYFVFFISYTLMYLITLTATSSLASGLF